ncbi:MAG: ATP-binding protein [Xanthobacteraceae bacterium]|nr:ATP-binding protein [Xanthobacteraceae bacterium]
MGRTFRIKARMRRFARRHPRITYAVRAFVLFSAAFGGAYGFVSGSQSQASEYNPRTFAFGVSFLFALACVALALTSIRLRRMRKKLRLVTQHNERLIDRNWELKEAEERARNLFESQGDLVVLRQADGAIRFVNDAYCALAQRPRETLVGTRFELPVLEQGKISIDAVGTRTHDQKIATATGARWIGWREGLVRPDAGQPAELQCVGRDVTDRTETARALGEARDNADAASRAKSRFLAMVSHEIRTPLNGIIGMNGLLLDTTLTPEQANYAEAVRTSAEALLSLIEELLDFSKIEAGKIDLEQRPFALDGLIEGVSELLAPRAQARGLDITAYVDERLPPEVIGDHARLRQVLLNLAGNAIKFTERGGVALVVEPGSRPNDVLFMVRDTGIGIAPDAQQRIFQEFEQADERIAQSYGGTGLGLSISERIVRRMGGHITLQSALGEGSTFSFAIPMIGHDGGGGARRRPFDSPDLNGKSVMLVAPRAVETPLVARHLQRWGARTAIVADLASARALLAEGPWHAILIDGAFAPTEAAAFASAAAPHAVHRLVIFTPATRHAYRDLVRDHFTGYLVKPLRVASLASRLGPPAPASAAGEAHDNEPLDARTPKAAARRGLSILVAEDNEINALLMRALLTRLGHQVVVTTDGNAAVESWLAAEAAEAPYDLVLMDVQMPELNGIEATRRIRAREAGQGARRTPIVALTANALAEDRDACFESGMDGFLIKPLDRDKLAETIAGFAARHLAA